MNFPEIRHRLAAVGLTPAASAVPFGGGHRDEVAVELARLVEGTRVEAIPVGPAEPWPAPVAFLDGTQHLELLGYAGTFPILGAEVAAAVRERRNRDLCTVVERRRSLVLARAGALGEVGVLLGDAELVELPDDRLVPSLRDVSLASGAVDDAREALEVGVGLAFRERSAGWLVVDGSLGASTAWLRDERMVGVSRSHALLPFEGQDLDTYLRLPSGHRSPVFAPSLRHGVEYRAWALRLWPWEGKDVLHGLVRVEVSVGNGSAGSADLISRWLLAERAPISAPESRWDTLLYPIRGVREYLRVRSEK